MFLHYSCQTKSRKQGKSSSTVEQSSEPNTAADLYVWVTPVTNRLHRTFTCEASDIDLWFEFYLFDFFFFFVFPVHSASFSQSSPTIKWTVTWAVNILLCVTNWVSPCLTFQADWTLTGSPSQEVSRILFGFFIFTFYNCIFTMGFLPCYIRVAFPRGKPAVTESRYPAYDACWVF